MSPMREQKDYDNWKSEKMQSLQIWMGRKTQRENFQERESPILGKLTRIINASWNDFENNEKSL